MADTATAEPTTPGMGMIADDAGWGWWLALGISMILLGVLAIIMPLAATLTMSLFIGWFLLIGGIAWAIQSIVTRKQGNFWGRFLLAALMGVAGFLMVTNVLASTFTLTVLIGWYFIISGAFQAVVGIADRKEMPGWGWMTFGGALGIVLGIMILNNLPSSSAWAIGLLVGVQLIFAGWWNVWGAVTLHKAANADSK